MNAISKAPVVALALATLCTTASAVRADEVTEWNQILLRAGLASGTPTYLMIRNASIVQASVFDAVNGIDQQFAPLHVMPAAPAGASIRAAAVQAAYAALVQLIPTQKTLFDGKRFVSLAEIAEREDAASIASGVAWGQTVADAMVAFRSTDGFTVVLPPFLGGSGPGVWRPTPPAFLPGATPQLATAMPWVLTSPSQFRPGPFPDLTSAQYAADVNEVQVFGSATSTARSVDQTTLAYFWGSATSPVYTWDTVATSLMAGEDHHHHALVEHARILALVDIALSDGLVAGWDGKYHYLLWRPITAITLADTDGNPATTADPSWMPLLTTPPYPSYASGLLTVSSAAATVLASAFGDRTRFTVRSDTLLGVTRSFRSFSAALDELADARVLEGIHFRFDDLAGRATGTAVGNYILEHALQPLQGQP
jgi:hypothetical protein